MIPSTMLVESCIKDAEKILLFVKQEIEELS